jgi:hypothetical protein
MFKDIERLRQLAVDKEGKRVTISAAELLFLAESLQVALETLDDISTAIGEKPNFSDGTGLLDEELN